jgi:hypothetical protein
LTRLRRNQEFSSDASAPDAAAEESKSGHQNYGSPAPARLTLPQGPNLASFQPQEHETHASALVRAFEEKYVDSDTKEPYSPCRLWMKLARKEAGHK